MDEDVLRTIKRILIGLIIVVLLAGMTFMLLRYRRNMAERSQRIASLSAEADVYETELNELRRQQELEEMHLYEPQGPGAAVIAFLVNGGESLATALRYGETYGFTPVILLRVDEETDSVIDAISGAGLDVILYSRGIGTSSSIRALLERLEDEECNNTYAYLLRAGDDTEENRRTLASAGITTLFLYGDSLTSTVTDNGTVELNYSYINRSSYSPANRLKDLSDSEQGLLFAIDLIDTTVTERQMDEIISLISDEASAGRIKIGSVNQAVETVKTRRERETASVQAFLETQEERSARIRELENTIQDIYSHWDD